jgi:hypothetical protein
VGEAGAVIERSVDEPVADTCVTASGARTATVEPPAAAVRDAGDLLHVNVDQLTRTFPLIAQNRFGVRGPVSSVESSATGSSQRRAYTPKRSAPPLGSMWSPRRRSVSTDDNQARAAAFVGNVVPADTCSPSCQSRA